MVTHINQLQSLAHCTCDHPTGCRSTSGFEGLVGVDGRVDRSFEGEDGLVGFGEEE